MTFISEETIDTAALELEAQPEKYEQLVAEFQEHQPELLAYILSDDTSFLTSEERDHLLYLSLVIWKAVGRKNADIPRIKAENIGKTEDRNWEKLETVKSKSFRERLDIFFVDYAQEDLLAFVEDALSPDEESPISKEGREPLFIALKTLIDVIAVY